MSDVELILGTAEFNKDGYAGNPPPDNKEILKILNLAWEGGINHLAIANSYNLPEVVYKWTSKFKYIENVRHTPKVNQFYHYTHNETPIKGIKRASVYTLVQLEGVEEAIVPFNIDNTMFIDSITDNLVRSVFNRGELLKEYSVKDCLNFVKRHYPLGVIVGVKSVDELDMILRFWK